MGTVVWLIGGFALLGLSGLLESIGDGGATPAERLPYYIPSLIALMGAPFCFFRGIRGATSEMFGKKADKATDTPSPAAFRPARRLAELADEMQESDFDPDAAFARYMARRATQQTDEPAAPVPTAARPPQPASARPAFGRRIV